jgi:hypothetical protein
VSDHFSDAFNIALVLLGVLSSAETQFFIGTWGAKTALQFVTFPFLVIIWVWLPKELFKSTFQKDKKHELLFSEFCWELWCLTLAFYLLFLYLYLYPQFALMDFLYPLFLGISLYGLIILAYWVEYKTEVEYYKSRKWIRNRLFTNIAGIAIVLVIFLLTPKG